MGRRIEVELTSIKDESHWTWRAAGAKKPKGDLAASLLYEGAKVGDVVKVEADFHVDGIEVTEVFAPKGKKERTNLLEMKSRPLRDDELVTTQRVSRDKRDRKPGRKREGRDNRSRENRSPRPRRAEVEQRPKPKRLRPKRVHRDAYLTGVTEEHRPIVEQVVRDGMPGVRAAIDKQNAAAKEAGKPAIEAAPILAIAEQHLSPARLAEWQDKADAAMAEADELDLRDLRSLVVAGADVARDDETRATVETLKEVLNRRLEADHAAWLSDMSAAVNEGRVVRGLRLSSRPVKAGAPLPTEIASKLAQQAAEALAPDVGQDRWATVLDALAYSPVRAAVSPAGIPAEPKEELLVEVRRLSDRLPSIAGLFGIDPADVPKSAKRRPPRRKNTNQRPKKKDGKPEAKKEMRPVPGAEKKEDAQQEGAARPADASDSPSPETTTASNETVAPAAEAPTAESVAPAAEAPKSEPETPTTEAPTAESETPTAEASEPDAATAEGPQPAASEPTAASDDSSGEQESDSAETSAPSDAEDQTEKV